MTRPRICLVVDNPLRDLDGSVLLAWQLARRGAEAWLVPMYEQSFDLRAIGADAVLMNYVRLNNRDHVMAYRREGIRVAVLDTEGVGGKSPQEFARLVAASGAAGAIDLYCVWGEAQREALVAAGVVPGERIAVTGCPRYDFCAPPWQDALPRPAEPPGYMLVNTNFPIINPRYSRGAEDEMATAIQAGFPPEFATAYVRDARRTHAALIELLDDALARWPEQRFVLRPHPFESHDCYRPLERHANFALRQSGTSVEWLNQARALVHLNCSTAVEAAMLGVPAISPGWLDTPALHVPGPSSVSRLTTDMDDFRRTLDDVLRRPRDERRTQAMAPLRPLYHDIDGHAAARVADATIAALAGPPNPVAGPDPSPRSRAILALRGLLGHALSTRIADGRVSAKELERRRNKRFETAQVVALVDRLQACEQDAPRIAVEAMSAAPLHNRRLASGTSIRLALAAPPGDAIARSSADHTQPPERRALSAAR